MYQFIFTSNFSEQNIYVNTNFIHNKLIVNSINEKKKKYVLVYRIMID